MLIIPAFAKLNLALAVGERRADGYHDIHSLVVALDWHDLVGVKRIDERPHEPVRLRVSGPRREDIPSDEANLAFRAAELVANATGGGVDVWIDKWLPVGAGLGGGSSDAAAVLRAVSLPGWPRCGGIDVNVLRTLAAEVGSDVPACFDARPVRVGGRGDVVTPLPTVPPAWLVVVVAGATSTRSVYSEVLDADREGPDRIDALAAAWGAGGLPDALCGSGLEAAARRATPAFADRLDRLRAAADGERWHVTGSGGAVFSVPRDRVHAAALATRVAALGFEARICRTITG